MSFWSRLKFTIGIMVVFLMVGLLALYLNSTLSTVQATQAYLGADTTTVGVDYAGQVLAQHVNAGQKVRLGQVMFKVQSPTLASDIANRTVDPSTLPFTLNKDGNISVTAPASGIVQKVNYQTGSYVSGGTVMAVIYNSHSLYITGAFHLTPPDYTRLTNGEIMDVTFPDDTTTQAKVYNIALQQNGSTVVTIVNARLPRNYKPNPVFSIGTPVQASLRLTKNTWWDTIKKEAHKLISPK